MTHRFGSIFVTIVLLAVVTLMAPAQWTDWQDAEYVLGQPDFIWDYWGCTSTRLGFGGSGGAAIDLTNSKLYVADISNNRVLRFAYPLTGNEPIAELVFGQAVMTSGSANRGGSPAANTMKAPRGIAVHNGDLWVAESGNNRVIKYSAAWSTSSNGPNATVVLGQPDFTTTSTGTSSSQMNSPAGICFDASGNLWVVDELSNRVLEFVDASNKASGAPASRVLGQPDFASQSAPDPPTGSSLNNPTAVCADGTRLWVVDKSNSRVLRYDNATSKADGAAADGVLGQSDFVSKTVGTTATTLNLPQAAVADGAGRLYVVDRENNRVLIYNDAKAKGNGGDADNVLGQFDMVSSTPASSRNRFGFPSLVEVDNVNGKVRVLCRFSWHASSLHRRPMVSGSHGKHFRK
jgi:sugar lactone lactonase YvrE